MSRTLFRTLILISFACLCVLGFFISIVNGAMDLPYTQIWQALWQPQNDSASLIVWNLRLPRTILAALVGINLALSGAILQGIMHNPLADPNIIGVSSGAGLAGIIVLILYPAYEYLITPFSFLGAMLACLLIYILAWKDGVKPVRVILAGVAVSAFLGSIITSLMIFYSDKVHGALLWMVGGLTARGWSHIPLVLPYTIIGLIFIIFAAHYLNILQLGDEMARGLGVSVEKTRICLTMLAALLAASAVSAVGLLGFVGLIIPHIVRLLTGSDYRILLPGSALLGATILMLSDTLARMLLNPIELPVGIIMAFLGAPFFLYLLRKTQ
ncbi:MAG: iron ABC transporter permease [Acidaminococcaceae bacterium]|nr:iron ABC transporter permease [Acidaminococcaceae bacterium]